MHLVDRSPRPGEVLERGLADDQVEGAVRERHGGRVALPELHGDARLAGVLARDVNERLADVERGHPVAAEPRQLDGEVAGTGRHLQDRGAVGEPGRDLGRLPPPRGDLAGGAAQPRIPPCHDPLHGQAPVSLSPRRAGGELGIKGSVGGVL